MEQVEVMEIEESAAPPKSVDFKYKLLEKLDDPDTSLTKNLTLAITIQTMFSKDLEVMEKLFQFFINNNQIHMAKDLWENELLTKFNLTETTVLDKHLNKIVHQIVYHLSMKTLSTRDNLTTESDSSGEFYLQLFLKFSPPIQEKLVAIILEKYRAGFAFLKTNIPAADPDKSKPPNPAPTIDIKEFYTRLIQVKENIFLIRNLLAVYKKFIPEYGLFLIDGFLNIEKQLFANLIQNSSDQLLSSIERRSLNVIRRICVVDLIPEFVCLIEKLDNRHCYRWIEKSLEFFTKYTLNSIDVKFEFGQSTNGGIRLSYSNVKLLSVSKIKRLFNI